MHPELLCSRASKVLEEEITTMFIYESNEYNIPNDTEARYEAVASQEEISLEETEEEVVAILTSYVSPASQSDRSTIIDICG